MTANARRGEIFFPLMGLVLLALVIAGFVPPAFSRPGGPAAIPLLLHVHGAIFAGWFVLFIAQARLIGAGNARLHRRIGAASLILALAIVVLGFAVIGGAYARPDWSIAGLSPAASVMFPFTDIVNFTAAFALAFVNRHNPAAHKRFMLLAGILIMDPAVARLVATAGLPVPMILVIELALLAALIVYDIRTRRRPHWASLTGVALFAAAMFAKLVIAGSAGWATFVDGLFG
ncbi:hypothetical protein [Lentisalinibacter sediminis]